MGRYLRLYVYFLRFSFSRAMEFRTDFFFRIFMDCAFYVIHLAFFGVLYQHTQLLGGWNLDQVLIFVAGVFVSDAVQMTLFSNNQWWLPIFVNRGDLDYYLTRPVSSLYFLSLRDFAANSFFNLVVAASILFWAVTRYPGHLPATNVAVYLVLLGNGFFLWYMLRMFFIIPVFWTHSARGLDQTSWSLQEFGERPHRIYTPWVRRSLMSIFPLALMISVPTQVLFEGPSLGILVNIAGVTGVTFGLLVWFWGRGLANYSSASS